MAGSSGCRLDWGGFDKALANAGSKLANHHELLESCGEALVSGTVRRFADEEAPDGTGWEPSQRAAQEGGKTLTDTGRLRNSIDSAVSGDKVMVGTNVVYALIHQKGGTVRPKKAKRLAFTAPGGEKVFAKQADIPARPFIGISGEDMEEVRHTVEAFMAGAFKK